MASARLGVPAVANAAGLYQRMTPINLEGMLSRFAEVLKGDAACAVAERFRHFIAPEENNSYWPEIYDVTFPACVRCNTLMTMVRKSTELMKALRAIGDDWYDLDQLPKSHAIRRYRYGLLVRKSVKHAQNVFRGHLVPVTGDAPRDNMEPVQDAALVQLVQTVFLAMSAMIACAGKGEDEADHFRYAGIRRLYLSAVMWVLCRMRWSSAFRTPFVHWHIHYVENMPLAQRRSFHAWLFCGHEPVQLAPGASVSETGVYRMLHRCLVPALVAVMDDDFARQRLRFEAVPSMWQLMYLCTPDVCPNTFHAHTLSRQVTDEDRKFLPMRGYAAWARSQGLANSQRLDVGVWVDAFGSHVALRRMVVCAVFHMPTVCAALLLQAIKDDGTVPAWATGDNPAPPAGFDLLEEYEAFMLLHYRKVYRLSLENLRGRRQQVLAQVDENDFNNCADAMRAATAYDRIAVARGLLDAAP